MLTNEPKCMQLTVYIPIEGPKRESNVLKSEPALRWYHSGVTNLVLGEHVTQLLSINAGCLEAKLSNFNFTNLVAPGLCRTVHRTYRGHLDHGLIHFPRSNALSEL